MPFCFKIVIVLTTSAFGGKRTVTGISLEAKRMLWMSLVALQLDCFRLWHWKVKCATVEQIGIFGVDRLTNCSILLAG